jgi:soluble lytic murein transglycosylase-like protein
MMPAWALSLPWNLITTAARANGVDANLIAAIVQTESGGQMYATRYERAYKYIVEPDKYAKNLGITIETETLHQATSWGLMQVMGGTLRDLGFREHIPKICQPNLNLDYGSRLLARLCAKHSQLSDVIASYNAGSPRKSGGVYENQIYVDKVLKLMNALKSNPS